MTNRRKNISSGYINIPKINYPIQNTGEGGMSFFLLGCLPKAECCVDMQCLVHPTNTEICHKELLPKFCYADNNDGKYGYKSKSGDFHKITGVILATTCIFMGSTGLSLWNDDKLEYWIPAYYDLNEDGRKIYNLVRELHKEVRLASVLDT